MCASSEPPTLQLFMGGGGGELLQSERDGAGEEATERCCEGREARVYGVNDGSVRLLLLLATATVHTPLLVQRACVAVKREALSSSSE